MAERGGDGLLSDPDELRAFAQALQAQHAATVAKLASTAVELCAAKATIQLATLEIEKLKVQLARLRRMQFAQSLWTCPGKWRVSLR